MLHWVAPDGLRVSGSCSLVSRIWKVVWNLSSLYSHWKCSRDPNQSPCFAEVSNTSEMSAEMMQISTSVLVLHACLYANSECSLRRSSPRACRVQEVG